MTGEAESARNGSLVLAMAAVLFAVAVLPFVLEEDSGGNAAAYAEAASTSRPSGGGRTGEGLFPPSPTSTRGGATPPRSGTTQPDPYERPDPVVPTTPVRDPREEAFEAVASVGTCLNAYQVGDGQGGWNTEVPKAAPCGTWGAFARVAGVNGTCPSGDMGYARWGYGDVSLCLEREFQKGQCFLVTREGGSDSEPRYSGSLFTWVDCDAKRIPADYDSLLVIAAVYRAPASIPRGVCSQGQNDRTYYWYWLAKNNSTLVCATYPAR